MGSSTLKLEFLIRIVVWKLKPCVLLALVRHFNCLAPAYFSNLLTSETEKLARINRFSGLSVEEEKARTFLQKGFNNAIVSLSGGDVQAEQVMIEAHVLGVAIKQDISNTLEQIVDDIDTKAATADCIVQVYLKHGISIIHQALRMNMVRQQKTYRYYVPGESFLFIHRDTEPREPSEELLRNAQAQLQDFFENKYTSRLCEIVKGVFGTRYFLSITHAGPYMQDRRVTNDKPESFSFRPVEYDTVVFDLQTRDLCVHTEAGRKRDINEYIKLAGALFFEEERFWGMEEKYTLIPLKQATKKDLRNMLDVENAKTFLCIPNGKLNAIRLSQIKYIAKMSNGSISSRQAKNSLCLSEELKNDSDVLIPEPYQLTEAIINIDYTHAQQGGQTASLHLSPQSKKFAESTEGVTGTDEWLNSLGFTRRQQFHAKALPDWFSKLSEEDKKRFAPKKIEDSNLFDTSTTASGDLLSKFNEPS